MCFADKDLAFLPSQKLREMAPKRAPLYLGVEGTFMTNKQLSVLIASLAACVCAAGLSVGVGLGAGQASWGAGPTNARLAACVCAAGFSFLAGIGRSRQTGPSQDPAGHGKNFARTALGPQRDLFGTPFGPLFLLQTGAEYANLPDFRRNRVRGAQGYTRKAFRRGHGLGGEAFPAPPLPDGRGPAHEALLMVPARVLPRRRAGASVVASSHQFEAGRLAKSRSWAVWPILGLE